MSDMEYGLLEKHHKLDERLRFAQSRRLVDPLEIVRLKLMKLGIRDRLARLARKPASVH